MGSLVTTGPLEERLFKAIEYIMETPLISFHSGVPSVEVPSCVPDTHLFGPKVGVRGGTFHVGHYWYRGDMKTLGRLTKDGKIEGKVEDRNTFEPPLSLGRESLIRVIAFKMKRYVPMETPVPNCHLDLRSRPTLPTPLTPGLSTTERSPVLRSCRGS